MWAQSSGRSGNSLKAGLELSLRPSHDVQILRSSWHQLMQRGFWSQHCGGVLLSLCEHCAQATLELTPH